MWGGKGAGAVYLFLFLENTMHLSIIIDCRPGESSVTVTGSLLAGCCSLQAQGQAQGSVSTFLAGQDLPLAHPAQGFRRQSSCHLFARAEAQRSEGCSGGWGCLAGGSLALDPLRNVHGGRTFMVACLILLWKTGWS